MVKKNALGRGLGSLIKNTLDEPVQAEKKEDVKNLINIDEIYVNPYQPRKVFEDEEIESLAISIKENQLLNPVVVTKRDDKYIIVSGERRFRAIKSLQWDKVPVSIIDVDDKDLSVLALVENVQRVDLNDMEKSYACAELKKEFSLTDTELAKQIGMSRSAVSNLIRLITLPSFIKDGIKNGKVTAGQVRPLIGIDLKRQNEIYDKIIDENLSARKVESLVSNFKVSPEKKPTKAKKIPAKEYSEKLKNKIVSKSLKIVKNEEKYEMSVIFEDEEQFKLFLKQYE